MARPIGKRDSPIPRGNCAYCGASIFGRANKRYCDSTCATKGYQKQYPERHRAQQKAWREKNPDYYRTWVAANDRREYWQAYYDRNYRSER